MIVDLEKTGALPGCTFDVCVVGAGAAGIVLAVELARHGRNVVVLEAGGERFEARSQDLCFGQSIGLPYSGHYNGRSRVLGGTTTLWGGQIVEPAEHIFLKRPWVSGGEWPFPKSELMPAYGRARALEGLDGSLDDPAVIWRTLGLHPPDFGDDLRSTLSRWCPQRNFARLHGRALRSSPRILVVLHANVCELRFAADGKTVQAACARTLDGRQADFHARAVVLAVGGIETCRLLLQPTNNAPWSTNRLIGRHFQDHISCFVATVVADPQSRAERYFDYASANGFKYHPKIELKADAQARLGTLDVCGTVALTADGVDDLGLAYETYRLWQTRRLRSLTPARLLHLLSNLPGLLWQKAPYARRIGTLRRRAVLRLCVHCEQAPLSAARVELTPERDVLGLLKPRVNWCTSDLELYSIRAFSKAAQKALGSRGLGQVILDRGIEDDETLIAAFKESFHHIGGTRMAGNAAEGVVDVNLRLFGTRNAYVCSTSVFPSAGFGNPTHTLLALAVRLAAHLAQTHEGAQQRSDAGSQTIECSE